MNINIQRLNSAVLGGMVTGGNGLKSTQQRIQRQEERDNKIAFFEQQKNNLKNLKCETVEEIAKKLDMFHSYEDQIVAAKAAYNNEQMMHLMDESQERGEKIAEALEKSEPKTAEERLEDMAEEAMGVDKGVLDEMMDEVMDEVTEMQEELQDAISEESLEEAVQTTDIPEMISIEEQVQKQIQEKIYTPIDLRI